MKTSLINCSLALAVAVAVATASSSSARSSTTSSNSIISGAVEPQHHQAGQDQRQASRSSRRSNFTNAAAAKKSTAKATAAAKKSSAEATAAAKKSTVEATSAGKMSTRAIGGSTAALAPRTSMCVIRNSSSVVGCYPMSSTKSNCTVTVATAYLAAKKSTKAVKKATKLPSYPFSGRRNLRSNTISGISNAIIVGSDDGGSQASISVKVQTVSLWERICDKDCPRARERESREKSSAALRRSPLSLHPTQQGQCPAATTSSPYSPASLSDDEDSSAVRSDFTKLLTDAGFDAATIAKMQEDAKQLKADAKAEKEARHGDREHEDREHGDHRLVGTSNRTFSPVTLESTVPLALAPGPVIEPAANARDSASNAVAEAKDSVGANQQARRDAFSDRRDSFSDSQQERQDSRGQVLDNAKQSAADARDSMLGNPLGSQYGGLGSGLPRAN